MSSHRNIKIVALISLLVLIGIAVYLLFETPSWLIGIKGKIISWTNQSQNSKLNLNGLNTHPTSHPNIIKYSIYSDPKMNISFNFPQNIQTKKINDKLMSLYDPSKTGDDNTLYIYSAIVPENTDNFKIPFTIPGPMKHSSIIKLHEFTANQETYGDGANEVNLLVLRKKDQTIVLRIPKNSKPLDQTITQVVNSIHTLQ